MPETSTIISLREIVTALVALVLGAFGFIGRHLFNKLEDKADQEDLNKLAEETVPRAEVQGIVDRLADSTQRVLDKVDETTQRADQRAARVHTKIDDMDRRMAEHQTIITTKVAVLETKVDVACGSRSSSDSSGGSS